MRGGAGFGILGLALVLFAVLIVTPYILRFTVSEGFAEATEAPNEKVAERVEQTEDLKEKVIELLKEVKDIETLLENPELEQTTKDKLLSEIQDRRAQIAKLTGQPLPSETAPAPAAAAAAEVTATTTTTVEKEGFQGVLSADLERNTRSAALVQMAGQEPF